MSTTVLDYARRRGTGPTLVLVHDSGPSAHVLNSVADRLPGRDLVAIDLRRSFDLAGPCTNLDRYANDALAVIAEAGITDYVLVGHSTGGEVAQLIGATGPVGLRGLVLGGSSPATQLSGEVNAQVMTVAALLHDDPARVSAAAVNPRTQQEPAPADYPPAELCALELTVVDAESSRLRVTGTLKLRPVHGEAPASLGWQTLTETERLVASLIARGHTNQQAAHRLGRSTNTIGTHLRSIFTKMQVQSRVQLANALSSVIESPSIHQRAG